MKKFIIGLAFAFLTVFVVQAQTTETETVINLSQADKQLIRMMTKLNSGKSTKGEVSDFLRDLTDMQGKLQKARQFYSGDLSVLQKKIDALGNVPETGTKEPAELSKQRKEFTAAADTLKAQIAKTDLLTAKIDEINALILKIRNRQLLNNILVKQSSIFHPQEFWHSLTSFAGFVFKLVVSPVSWYQELPADRQDAVNGELFLIVFSMLLASLGAFFLGRYIKRNFGYLNTPTERPDYSQKMRMGLVMFAARGLIPAAVIGAFLIWLRQNELFNQGAFGMLLNTAAFYLLGYYLVKAAVKAVFVADCCKWRLVEMSDERARAISSSLIFSSAAICIVSFFQSLANQMDYDASIVYSLKIFANAVKAFCIIWVARRALYDSKTLSDEELSADEQITGLSTSSKISLLLSVVVIAAFGLSLFGYIRLSEFIINRIIASVVLIGIVYMIDQLLRGIIHRLLLLRFWVRNLRINRRKLVKTEFWFGLLLTPVMWVIGGFALLALWGVSVDLMLARIKSVLIGFNVGGMHISITSILLGVVSFFVMLSLFKMLKNSFRDGKLSKIEMDDGLRNSVVSSINFLGFIISGILAIAVMGGSLSSIALIAGALSFGVGLGLQNMVSNLAAGLTILWARPIKIGDWVIINGYEGVVKQINVRSTELETAEKSTIIIPNSDILSKSVVNYTYAGRLGRIVMKVTVDYSNDITKVKDILKGIAVSNAEVLARPAPSVTCSALSAANMEFTLTCFTGNVFSRGSIGNDLREKTALAFKENDIKMA